MAQYHKIPQNVTSYEGRIVGKFTAKQFIFLAIGAIGVFLIVNSPLNRTMKAISAGIIGLTSLILAVANVDGRSTDFWLSTFMHVAYIPTQRVWRKSAIPPRYLLPSYHPPKKKRAPRKRTATELNELLDIWKPVDTRMDEMTENEKIRLAKIREYQNKSKKIDNRTEEIINAKRQQTSTNTTSSDSVPEVIPKTEMNAGERDNNKITNG
jgi:hypothetical protein